MNNHMKLQRNHAYDCMVVFFPVTVTVAACMYVCMLTCICIVQLKGNLTPACGLPFQISLVYPQNSHQTGVSASKCSYLYMCQVT